MDPLVQTRSAVEGPSTTLLRGSKIHTLNDFKTFAEPAKKVKKSDHHDEVVQTPEDEKRKKSVHEESNLGLRPSDGSFRLCLRGDENPCGICV